MRRIVLVSVAITALLVLPIQYQLISPLETDIMNTFYFREGPVPYLSKLPPEREDGSITLAKTFVLQNVTSIGDKVYFDLYFKAPLFNLTGIMELLFSILPVFSNVTIEQQGENRNLREILENISIPEWNISKPSPPRIISKILYSVSLEIEDIEKTKTIEICRLDSYAGDHFNLSLENIFKNLTKIMSILLNKESKIVHKEFFIDDINLNLSGETTLFVSVLCEDEILQTLAPIIETIRSTNESDLQAIVGEYLETNNMTRFKPLAGLFVKFTKILLSRLSDSVGFIYDTTEYPSNLKFCGVVTGAERFGAEKYYLKRVEVNGNYALIMDREEIKTNKTVETEISSNGISWEMKEPFDEPIRILGNVTLHLYIQCDNPVGIYPIEASIYDKNGETSVKVGSATAKIAGYKYISPSSLDIVIENIDHTFESGHSILLTLSIVNRTIENFGIELTFYRPKVLFNSDEYPSYLQVITAPLDDIRLKFSEKTTLNPEIGRAEVAHYDIEITNRGETGDTLTLSLELLGEFSVWPDGWRAVIGLPDGVEIAYDSWEDQIYIPGKEQMNISLDIYPSPDSPDGSEVYVLFSAEGTYRGSDYLSDTIRIKIGKIDIKFVAEPENKEIEVGKSFSYTFKVRNVGEEVDDFIVNATSEHGWIVGNTSFVIEDLYPGNETEFSITIRVPRNISSLPVEDNLTVLVKSKTDPDEWDGAWVVTKAVELSIFDRINEFFGGITNSLKGQFGEAASLIVIAVLLAMVLIIILSLIYVFTRKYAELICLDRIKEISPGEEARFDITIKNPSKMRLSYDAYVDKDIIPEGWDVKISESEFRLDPGEERKVSIFVKATENIDPDGFAKIRLFVIPKEKSKTYYMDLIVTSKNAIVDLKIENVSHLPRTFKSGDTVTTKFILRNKGTVRAKNVRVSLRVNGEEVNSADIEEIPPEGYAEIEMPWIAYPGRNDISIVAEM